MIEVKSWSSELESSELLCEREFEWTESDLPNKERVGAELTHKPLVVILICVNQLQDVETVMLKWLVMNSGKSQMSAFMNSETLLY